jgi:O-antigen ligase/Flp pilus assembly protein TadD
VLDGLWLLPLIAAAPIAAIPNSVYLMSAAVVAVVFAVVSNRANETGLINKKLRIFDISVLLLVASHSYSLVTADYLQASLFPLSFSLSGGLVYCSARLTNAKFDVVVPILTGLGTVLAIIGLLHFSTQYRQWSAVGFHDIISFRAYVDSQPFPFRSGDANAFYLIELGLALATFDNRLVPKPRPLWSSALSASCACLCLACILLSFSRGAYIAILFGLIAVLLVRNLGSRYAAATFVICCIAGMVMLSLPHTRGRIETELALHTNASQQRSTLGRLNLLSASLELVRHKPFFGNGVGNFPVALAEASSYDPPNPVIQPYNMLIASLVESGVVGIIALLFVVYALLHCLYGMSRRSVPISNALFILPVAALGAYSLFQAFLLSGRTVSLLIFLGLALYANKNEQMSTTLPELSFNKVSVWILVSIGLILLPPIVDLEVRNHEIASLVRHPRRAGHELNSIKTIFHSEDAFIDFTNELYAPIPLRFVSNFYTLYAVPVEWRGQSKNYIASAAQHWTDLTRRLPFDGGAWENSSRLSAILNDRRAAIGAAMEAIRCDPLDYSHHAHLGILTESYGMEQIAQTAYSEAIAINPRLTYSRLWMDLEQRNKAIAASVMISAEQQVGENYRKSGDLLEGERLARLDWRNGRDSEAETLTSQIVHRLPTLEGAWELRGEILETRDGYESGRNYEKAVFLDPSDPMPHEGLARLALARHDQPTASNELIAAQRLRRLQRTRNATFAIARYHVPRAVANDTVPLSWMYYSLPYFDFEGAFSQLAAWAEEAGQPSEAQKYRQLAHPSLN